MTDEIRDQFTKLLRKMTKEFVEEFVINNMVPEKKVNIGTMEEFRTGGRILTRRELVKLKRQMRSNVVPVEYRDFFNKHVDEIKHFVDTTL